MSALRMVATGAGLAVALALVTLVPNPDESVARSPDTYFLVTTQSTGNFTVDYGDNDDFQDGRYRFTWAWKAIHVIRFTEGRLASASPLDGVIRFHAFEDSKLTVRYSADPPGQRREAHGCGDQAGPFRYGSNPVRGINASHPKFARHPGSWGTGTDPAKPHFSVTGPPQPHLLAGCSGGPLHRPAGGAMHGLTGFPNVRVEIPRGAFNPRSDKKHKITIPSKVDNSFGDGHDADGNFGDDAPHSVAGSSKVTIKFKALSEKAAAKKARTYGRAPALRTEAL